MSAAAALGSRLARAIVGHPWRVLALVAAATCPLALSAARVGIDSSVERLLDPTSADTASYERVRRLFGSEEFDIVAVLADDVFVPRTLEKVKRLSERLARVAGVAEVESIATVKTLALTPDGDLDLAVVMDGVPGDAAGVARLRARLGSNPLLADTLVSADGRAASLRITYEEMSDGALAASGVHDRIEAVLREFEGPERILFVGLPRLKTAAAALMRSDVLRFTPLTTLVVAAVLLISFRSVRGVVVPLVTTGVGLVWTLGLMGFADTPIDVATLILPSLLLAVGSAYSTHVVACHYEESARGGGSREVALRTLSHIGLPVLVTAFTTLVGFASLAVYRVSAIRHLGLFASFGIAALFALSLTLAVAALAVVRAPAASAAPASEPPGRLGPVLDGVVRFVLRRRRAVLLAALGGLAAAGAGIPRIRVETNYVSYFPPRSPIGEASRVVGERFGATANFVVVVEAPGEGALARIDTLRRMAMLQDFIDRLPEVRKTTSLVDYLRLVNRVLHEDDPAAFTLPETDRAVQQYLLLLPPEATRDVLGPDQAEGAIQVRSVLNGSRDVARTAAEIRRFAADLFPPDVRVEVTGTTVLLDHVADVLSQGQLESVVLATAVVFLSMAALFLSVRLGLVAMLPNLVPIVLFFGLLGWAEIPLSMSTAVVASIALGLGVDEAIHLLAEFNRRARRHADQERAVVEAMRSVGPPVLYTTVALTLGFLVFSLSNFVPIRQFGYLSALNVGASLLADLLLLPAFLGSVRFVTLWDVLTVKLGRAPQEAIPLFVGLSPLQARVAALLGELRTVSPGTPIVARGDAGDALFVVVNGQAQAVVTRGARRVVLQTLGRGDVFGEMGLLRRRPRTADVVAVEPTEVLVVDDRFLRVLARRPRLAAVVLFNLAHIVADRLQDTTERLVAAAERLDEPADRPG